MNKSQGNAPASNEGYQLKRDPSPFTRMISGANGGFLNDSFENNRHFHNEYSMFSECAKIENVDFMNVFHNSLNQKCENNQEINFFPPYSAHESIEAAENPLNFDLNVEVSR
jgi:hypothetical protein